MATASWTLLGNQAPTPHPVTPPLLPQADIDAGVNLVPTQQQTVTPIPGARPNHRHGVCTTPVTQSRQWPSQKTRQAGPNPITAAGGQTINYTIVVTNTGNKTQTGINVSDVLPNGNNGMLSGPIQSIGINGQLDVAETWTYTINYTATNQTSHA